jgi:hypothetical protein
MHLLLHMTLIRYDAFSMFKDKHRLISLDFCLCICVCVCLYVICIFLLTNFWKPEPTFMDIMAPEPISTAYFIQPSHQYVCICNHSVTVKERLYKLLPFVRSKQRKSKHVLAPMNTMKNSGTVWCFFYTVRVLLNESLKVCLRIPLWLLGNYVPAVKIKL